MEEIKIKNIINKVLQYYLVALPVLLFVLFLVSWVMGIYVDGIQSVLTSNGMRWLVGNFMVNFSSSPLAEIIFGLFSISVLKESGIMKLARGRISLKQKRALQITSITLAVHVSLFVLLLLLPNASLLSAFGEFSHSPLQKGWFGLMMMIVILIGNVYGYTSGAFVNLHDFIKAHVLIFKTVAPYFIILFVASQFVCCLDFSNMLSCFGNEANEAVALDVVRGIVYYVPLVFYIALAIN